MRYRFLKEVLFPFLLCCGLIAFQAYRIEPFEPNENCCDHLFYRAMTFKFGGMLGNNETIVPRRMYSAYEEHNYLQEENPFFLQPPFCYRLLTPFLAGLMPVDYKTAYYTITFCALVMTGFFLFMLIRKLGFSYSISLWSILFFAFMPEGTEFLLWDYMLVDPLLFFFLTVGLLSIVCKSDLWFSAIMLLGTVNKETTLVLIPLYFLYNTEEYRERYLELLKKTVLLGSPAIGAYLLIRALVPVPAPTYSLLEVLDFSNLRYVFSVRALRFWGATGLLALVGFYFSPAKVKKLSLLIIPIYMQVLFAVNLERLWVESFPIVILLALFPFHRMGQRRRVAANFLVLLLFGINFVYFKGLFYYIFPFY